jgi:hypothetical protein
MSYESYPLPDAAQFYDNTDQLVDPTARTSMGKGYIVTKARYTTLLKQFDFDSEVIASEKYLLEAFLKARKVGAEGFLWRNRDEAYGENAWQAHHVYIAGEIVHPATPTGHSYICTVPGTSAAAAPTFPTTANATVAESEGPTWKENTYLVRVREGGVKFTRLHFSRWKASIPLEEMPA